MDQDLDIRVTGLGKRYQLGQTLDLSRTFREMLMSIPAYARHKAKKAIAGAASGPPADPDTPEGTFWALRDINLEVKRGEVVGIIGRNGAGKSTLLKILARVTQPTAGRAEIRGRVGALLEVGTGFHPELTGRENIYLNGAILGMRRAEIDRKFDEIIAFAEVEQFLETPVKRYSSGMRVRLGFAVAAHLDPEILIVDEVLSVGDAAFRKKCLGKMQDVSGEGRTVLFISHNMASIRNLCPRSVLLEHGRIVDDGPSREVISGYLGDKAEGRFEQHWEADSVAVKRSPKAQLLSARLCEPETGEARGHFVCTEPIDLEVVYRVTKETEVLAQFHVKDAEGQQLFVAGEFQDLRWQDRPKQPGEYRVLCHLPADFFNEGTHYIDLYLISLSPPQVFVQQLDALALVIGDDLGIGGGRGFKMRAQWPPSVIRPRFDYDFFHDGRPL